ncbi:MAG: histidine--tRNA ligase [Nitrospirota bacterium]|nr:histidine--tRNA ligase [Nitrospirota bacterium]
MSDRSENDSAQAVSGGRVQAIQAVRGVKDVLPDESPAWQRLERICRDFFARYGFGEVRVPVFEVTQLFARSIGEATDIVEKEMYTFEDRNGQMLSLRPEGTAGVIRAYIQSGLQRESLTRLYYLGPMFRHERPQAGRLRQFHQIGAEALGSESPALDAEVLVLTADLFDSLGLLDGLSLEINSIGCPACRPRYTAALKGFLAGVAEHLCENCGRRKETNPLRVLDCKVESCRTHTTAAPEIIDHLCEGCSAHFSQVRTHLSAAGVAYAVNPRMVRGLDYYTRTAFEWTSSDLGAQSTVAAGGRYDRLVERLGGQSKPGIGFALGVERLLLLMDETREDPPHLFCALVGDEAEVAMVPVLRQVRNAGIRVDRAFEGSLKSQMKRAGKSGAAFCLIVGGDELARGQAILRDMAKRDQREIPLAGLADAVCEIVKAADA